MILAIAAQGTSVYDKISPSLGRCAAFVIVDTDTMSFRSVANPGIAAGGGAGVQTAEMLVQMGVGAVVSGSVGPNAYTVLERAKVHMLVAIDGTARDNVDAYLAGALRSLGIAGPSGRGRQDATDSAGPTPGA